MANMSNYLENKLIDFLFRGGSYTVPNTLYFALCTSTPTDASTGSNISEISGGNYSRQSLSSSAANWYSTQGDTSATSTGTTGTTSNVSSIAWNSVTWSGTVSAVAICDASTGGNVLFYSSLNSNKTIVSGDSISFSVSGLSIQLDN